MNPRRAARLFLAASMAVLRAACAATPPARPAAATPATIAHAEGAAASGARRTPSTPETVLMCQKVTCLHDVRVVLKRKDGSRFDLTVADAPTIQGGGISLLAGESLTLHGDVHDDRVTDLRFATAADAESSVIKAALSQSADGGMLLEVHNPYARRLKIRMGIMTLDNDRLLTTTSCPVLPGLIGIETWPYPLFQVWLADFQLLPADAPGACVE